MIKGLRGASIWSENLDNLLRFYRDLLGLPVAIRSPGLRGARRAARAGARARHPQRGARPQRGPRATHGGPQYRRR